MPNVVDELIIHQAPEKLKAMATDFGGLVFGNPSAVLQPESLEQLQAAIQYASAQQAKITVRARGLSQGGQSVAPKGAMTLDIQGMNKVSYTGQTVTCEPGAKWRDLLNATAPHGLIPKILPNKLDLTVGGALSVGGFGGNSFRYGPTISNVNRMKIVTADATVHDVTVEDALFHAALAGIGQFGVIAEAEIALRPFQPNTRSFYLIYDDHAALLHDMTYLAEQPFCTYMEPSCSMSRLGFAHGKPLLQWFYALQLSVEYDQQAPQAADVLSHLHFYQHIDTENQSTLNFAKRYDPRFAYMRASGGWQQQHPWLECILPLSLIEAELPDWLAELPSTLGDGHRICLINQTGLPQLFAIPDLDEPVACFNVTALGVPEFAKADAIAGLGRLYKHLLAQGGKLYLSGWFSEPMDKTAWQGHLGAKYGQWQDLKAKYDPNHCFSSQFLSFS